MNIFGRKLKKCNIDHVTYPAPWHNRCGWVRWRAYTLRGALVSINKKHRTQYPEVQLNSAVVRARPFTSTLTEFNFFLKFDWPKRTQRKTEILQTWLNVWRKLTKMEGIQSIEQINKNAGCRPIIILIITWHLLCKLKLIEPHSWQQDEIHPRGFKIT